MENTNESVFVWEAPKIITPEFRLYYDEAGRVVCYTCEKLEGNYIVIDAKAFAEGRPDVRVIDGKITNVSTASVVAKLMPNDNNGQLCVQEDISIIVDETYSGETIKWKMKTYELR